MLLFFRRFFFLILLHSSWSVGRPGVCWGYSTVGWVVFCWFLCWGFLWFSLDFFLFCFSLCFCIWCWCVGVIFLLSLFFYLWCVCCRGCMDFFFFWKSHSSLLSRGWCVWLVIMRVFSWCRSLCIRFVLFSLRLFLCSCCLLGLLVLARVHFGLGVCFVRWLLVRVPPPLSLVVRCGVGSCTHPLLVLLRFRSFVLLCLLVLRLCSLRILFFVLSHVGYSGSHTGWWLLVVLRVLTWLFYTMCVLLSPILGLLLFSSCFWLVLKIWGLSPCSVSILSFWGAFWTVFRCFMLTFSYQAFFFYTSHARVRLCVHVCKVAWNGDGWRWSYFARSCSLTLSR